MRSLLVLMAATAVTTPLAAAIKTETVSYDYGGTTLKGYLAYDDATSQKRPGVLVLHEWWGLDGYAKKRAEQLAGMGYVAFAADMYGNGKVVDHPDDARKMATAVRTNTEAWLGRAQAGLGVLAKNDKVDPGKLAAIGYCFGGSTALLLAYSGADLGAVVTFHAALPSPTSEQAKAIRAKVVVNTGADDPFIPKEAINKFRAALDAAKVNYQFVSYPGAVHSFTVPGADNHKIPGMAYNAAADQKSWALMKETFDRTFGAK